MNADVITVTASSFALVFGLVAVAALMAAIGIAVGARTPLTIRFVWPFRGTWDPFEARRRRQLAEDILRNVQPVSEERQRQVLNALAQTRVGSAEPIDNVVLFDPRR